MDRKKNNRYRNPANDVVDAAERGLKGAVRFVGASLKNEGRKIRDGYRTRGEATATRLAEEQSRDRNLKNKRAPRPGDVVVKEGNRFVLGKDGNWKPVNKPAAAPKAAAPKQKPAPVADYTVGGNVYDGNTGRLKKAASSPVTSSKVNSPVAPRASLSLAAQNTASPKPQAKAPEKAPEKPMSRGAFDTEAGKALMGSHNPGERATAPKDSDAKVSGDEYGRLKNAFYDADSPRKAAIAAKALQQYRARMEREKGKPGNSTIVN